MTRTSKACMVIGVATGLSACASAPRNPVLDKYPAGVDGRTSVIYYDVHGSTYAELQAEMRRRGPKVADSSFVGETRSPMRWTWRTETTGRNACSPRDVRVYVNAQILRPRWTPPSHADTALVIEWRRFLTALETHESGHKDISAKAGRDLVEQLRNMSGLCSQVGSRANDIARTIIDRVSEAQKAYDAETRHGVLQGTSFGQRRVILVPVLDASAPFSLTPRPRLETIRGVLFTSVESAWRAMPAAFVASGLTINAAAIPELDAVDVVLFVTARLEPDPSRGAVVINTVQAVARPAGAAPVACRSRGVMERQLLQSLRAALVGVPPR